MAEVWFTDKLREFPFPEFEGEKFLGEDTVWVKISGKYKMRFSIRQFMFLNILAMDLHVTAAGTIFSPPEDALHGQRLFSARMWILSIK